ncbi:hypothetical protein ACLBWH_12190 [Sphingomonas sp. M6A6_1c]
MTEAVFHPDGPAADRVEITNGPQIGPAKLTGQFGTTLDYTNAGRMLFCVDVVDVEGGRLTLYHDPSYEVAIVEAEEAARDWGVIVNDLVAPIA